MNTFLEHIGSVLQSTVINATPLAGGDINTVTLLETSDGPFVLKQNEGANVADMFEKEALGLEVLSKSNSFRIPKVISTGTFAKTSYLLLEYISNSPKAIGFWEAFAMSLVKLHKTTHSKFGLRHDNYIGSLVQKNKQCDSSVDFFITQRLQPQFKSAHNKGFVFKNLDGLYQNTSKIIPDEPSSLIHGDLWNGNYLVSTMGQPTLIDPAVSFASREMDLAMMQLFGGFPDVVFSMYNEQFPILAEFESRVALWQLYYILVHLNIFGGSYLQQAKEIVSRYS
ncbi:MAG: fructosamine kinase family protein [Aureisphaera sp.]